MAFRPSTVYKSRDKPKALPYFENNQNVKVRESFFCGAKPADSVFVLPIRVCYCTPKLHNVGDTAVQNCTQDIYRVCGDILSVSHCVIIRERKTQFCQLIGCDPFCSHSTK